MADNPTLSVAVLTLNEERHLGGLLESLLPLEPDEVLVVDSGSTDRTLEIARGWGARAAGHEWEGFAGQRNWAFGQVGGDWVLFLDADERLTPALAREIRNRVAEGTHDGFRLRRRNYFLGKPLRCWWPDATVRLVRKGKGRWGGGRVHERMAVDGHVGTLRAPLLHDPHRGLADQFRTQLGYAELSAASRLEQGGRFRWPMLLGPAWNLIKFPFLKGGLLEGRRAWVFAISQAIYSMQKVLLLAEPGLREKPGENDFPMREPGAPPPAEVPWRSEGA